MASTEPAASLHPVHNMTMRNEGDASLEAWCLDRAAALSDHGHSTPASDAIWDVIDEIRRRAEEA